MTENYCKKKWSLLLYEIMLGWKIIISKLRHKELILLKIYYKQEFFFMHRVMKFRHFKYRTLGSSEKI